MGDSDSQRLARHTQEIAFHLKAITKVLEALNTNMFAMATAFKTLAEARVPGIDANRNAFAHETEFTKDKVFDPTAESPKRHFQ